MAVTLDQHEVDDFLTNGHTLIVTCLDKDGYPHTTPLWYVYLDGQVHFRVRTKSQKFKHLARGTKVSALVETGDLWRELKAVMIRGRAERVENEEELGRFERAMQEKYAAFRESATNMPERVKAHYSTGRACYKVVPEKKLATWDNRKIRPSSRSGS